MLFWTFIISNLLLLIVMKMTIQMNCNFKKGGLIKNDDDVQIWYSEIQML